MCRFFLWIIYVLGMLEQFGTERYTWRLDIVQNLFEFWAQNLLIARIPLLPPDQNVSILFVNNIYIGNIRTVWHRKIYMKIWYSSKSLRILGSKFGYTPYTIDTSRPKRVDSFCEYYIYWEYQITIHEDLIKFKNLWILSIFLVWFCRPKMCWYPRGQNILIPPYCILPMLSYCLKCRKDIESKNPNVVKTKNGRIMLLSNCSVSNSKKSRFVKEQEASILLSSLGIKAPFSRIPLVGPILF